MKIVYGNLFLVLSAFALIYGFAKTEQLDKKSSGPSRSIQDDRSEKWSLLTGIERDLN